LGRVEPREDFSSVRPHWASKNAQTSSIAWADAVKVNEEKSSLGSTLSLRLQSTRTATSFPLWPAVIALHLQLHSNNPWRHWASKNAQTSSIAWADAVKVNEEKSSLGSTLPNLRLQSTRTATSFPLWPAVIALHLQLHSNNPWRDADKNAQTSSIAWADAVKVNEEKSSLGSTLPNWSTLVDRV
jgi:hypothetical protein